MPGSRRRAIAPAAALAVSLGLAACEDREPHAEQEQHANRSAVADDSAAADVAEASARLTACDLVTEQQLETILGLDLAAARLVNDHPADSQCRWDVSSDPQRGVALSLRALQDLQVYERIPGSVRVSGLGEAAVWNTGTDFGQLAVLAGGSVVSVSLLGPNASRAQTERIARAALDRAARPAAGQP